MILYNRLDCCSNRLSNYFVTVGDKADGTGSTFCGSQGGDTSGKYRIVVKCTTPLKGRYVHVILPGSKRILSLCEIEVNGERELIC